MASNPTTRAKSRHRPAPVFMTATRIGSIDHLVPIDPTEAEHLRQKKIGQGEIVAVEIRRARHPGQHRAMMALLRLVSQNMDPEPGVERLLIDLKMRLGYAEPVIPIATGDQALPPVYWRLESISFESMDQAEFREFWRKACRIIITEYWPGMTEEAIEMQAGLIVSDAERVD
jgi:hypothetical protein